MRKASKENSEKGMSKRKVSRWKIARRFDLECLKRKKIETFASESTSLKRRKGKKTGGRGILGRIL